MQHYSEWKLTTPLGIKHKLIRQWGSFQRDNATWNQEMCIRSCDLVNFIRECFPLPTISGNYLVFQRRMYPAGLPSLECKSVDVAEFTSGRPIDPFGAGVSLYTPDEYAATFEPYLQVTVMYGPSPANDQTRDPNDPTTFLEISCSESGEFLSSEINQDGDLMWIDQNGSSEEPDDDDKEVSRTVTSIVSEWTLKWPQIPYEFFMDEIKPRLTKAKGKVNSEPLPLFGDAPADTILFLNSTWEHDHTWRDGHAGTSPVTVTMRFAEKNFEGMGWVIPVGAGVGSMETVDVTHQHIWREGKGWMVLMVEGCPLYEQHDLMEIFEGS